MMCTFNDRCSRAERGRSFESHLPFIGQAAECGCPLPQAVADLAFLKGRHLFHQGDAVRGAFSLTAGLVALERVNEEGEMVILKLLRPGALFPCADLFADGVHGSGARAVTDVTTCFLPMDRLSTALADPAIRTAVMRHSCHEMREDESIIFRLCAGDLAQRILALLRELAAEIEEAADGSRSLMLPISWRDVAAMVGTSPEVLSRTLKRLSDTGRLAFTGRRVTLAADLPTESRQVG